MSKQINTLVSDIYGMLASPSAIKYSPEMAAKFAMNIGGHFGYTLARETRPREMGKLWASDLGKKCHRQLWYSFHEPSKAEPLTGSTHFKFLYGNIIEESLIYLAKEAGHVVTGEQQVVEYKVNPDWTVRGKIDAIIDGVLVDVKSTSNYGFKEYSKGINPSNDTFGYIEQLKFYHKNMGNGMEAGFVFIDKQNGHIAYTRADTEFSWSGPSSDTAKNIIQSLQANQEANVVKAYAPKAYGKSGNFALPTACSYCPFKHHCWRDANNGQGLKGYSYSTGPVWFVEIAREPDVPRLQANAQA